MTGDPYRKTRTARSYPDGSRSRSHEPIALAILQKLRTADFRDLYPGIEENLKLLSCSNNVTRVRATEAGVLAEQAREFYRASVAAGDPLTGRQLGRRYNRSPSWGRERIGEVKAHDQGRAGRRGSWPSRDALAQRPVRSDGTGADRSIDAAAA